MKLSEIKKYFNHKWVRSVWGPTNYAHTPDVETTALDMAGSADKSVRLGFTKGQYLELAGEAYDLMDEAYRMRGDRNG